MVAPRLVVYVKDERNSLTDPRGEGVVLHLKNGGMGGGGWPTAEKRRGGRKFTNGGGM